MNDDVITDLKQFIAATVSQTVTQAIAESEVRMDVKLNNLEKKITSVINTEIGSLREEMLDGFTGATQAIDPQKDQLDDHENRIVRLEQYAAV